MMHPRKLAIVFCVVGGAAVVLAQQPASSAVERPAPSTMAAAGQHWVATWGTAQQMYRATPAGGRTGGPAPAVQPPPAAPNAPPPASAFPPRRFANPPAVQSLNNQTVRMIVRTSMAGRSVRIRLSNALGASTVTIGAAHIAIRATDSSIAPGSDRQITFSGNPSATMYAGATLVSDPVSLNLPPLADVAVSLFLPQETMPVTTHSVALHTAYISKAGDLTGQPSIPDPTLSQSYYWLAGIDVMAPATAGTLVTFGDSITDGDQSTADTNGMWPAILAARLQANRATANIAVVNAGIGGNRILGDGNSGLARLYHDAITQPGVRWIMLLEGINDITAGARRPPPLLTAEEIIAAYRQVIEIAHLHGIKVIGCTITPDGGSSAFSEYGETLRQAANHWILTSGAFDGVMDFDAVTRDAADPKRFRAEVDSPDLLHPSNAGYKLMGDAVPLSLFK